MPLLDPSGPLSKELNSSIIKAANDEVTAAIESSSGKRSAYLKLDDEQRATIGKCAAQHGIIKAIRHFAKDFKNETLKESTLEKLYLEELEIRRREGRDMNITNLPSKKMGRPLMFGKYH